MASLMDVSLIAHFTSIYVFLLVFAGVYALLEKTKILGDQKKNLNAIISVVFALLIIISKPATAFISFVLPWFFILGLVILFMIFIGKMFGKSDKDIQWAFSYGTGSPVITWVIISVILIVVLGFSGMFGQKLLDYAEGAPVEGSSMDVPVDESLDASNSDVGYGQGDIASNDYGSNVLSAIFHPKVIGMLALFLVGLSAILLITKGGFTPFKR